MFSGGIVIEVELKSTGGVDLDIDEVQVYVGSGIFGLAEVMVDGGLFYGCFSIDLLGGGVFIVYDGG